MSLEIKVPEVGESITEVTIANWLKEDGDYVEMDEPICELESDKATFELNAEKAGKLTIKAQEGDTLEIGDLVCEIDTEAEKPGENGKSEEKEEKEKKEDKKEKGEAKDKKEDKAKSDGQEEKESEKKESKSSPEKTGEVKEMKVPEVGESITEVTISSWLKSDGDYVELDEVIAEVDSDKATFELPSEAEGFLKIVAEEGDTLNIGDTICKIEITEGGKPSDKEEKKEKEDEAKEVGEETGKDESYATDHASPAAAKILREKGIDPKEVDGSGKDGRITKEDALQAIHKEDKKETVEKEDGEEKKEEKEGDRNQRRKKLSSLRKTIAKRLVAVKNETAMLTTFNEVDMKPIMDLRKKYKEQFKEKYGVGLGFMSFFTKACCMALNEWEAVNAYMDGDEVVYNDYCDISIAVSTDRGLVVPVIRNAENLSFQQIESKIIELATKARENKITIEEMQGGTFTITNGGIFGSMLSTPIINSPQSAILGMHNIVQRPVVIEGEITVRPIMYVALSYDHRIVDGRESVSFLVRVKELLEDPTRLLIGV